MLPNPALTLTLPSIHDGNVLDCRVYHPASLMATNARAPAWQRHAAIVAHPYAPMGGSYDDPIIEAVVAELLRNGFLVGTFNFRGAGHSAGRTSWTARPERDDYMSFVGFLAYYVYYLDPFRRFEREQDEMLSPLRSEPRMPGVDGTRTPPPVPILETPKSPILLLAGYSYGAMVTTQLPPLQDVLDIFASPLAGSEAAQIRLRAENLATKENLILGDARAAVMATQIKSQPRSPSTRGVRVGGDESCSSSPRRSHDGFGRRRSFSHEAEERFRKGVNDLISKAKPRHSRQSSRQISTIAVLPPTIENPLLDGNMPRLADLPDFRPAYLLISPLQGVISHLATMSIMPTALTRSRERDHDENLAEKKLILRPSMAIYGDRDVFVAAAKLRTWAKRLQTQPASLFQAHEIEKAGHFWVEDGVMSRMRHLVDEFSRNLLNTS